MDRNQNSAATSQLRILIKGFHSFRSNSFQGLKLIKSHLNQQNFQFKTFLLLIYGTNRQMSYKQSTVLIFRWKAFALESWMKCVSPS